MLILCHTRRNIIFYYCHSKTANSGGVCVWLELRLEWDGQIVAVFSFGKDDDVDDEPGCDRRWFLLRYLAQYMYMLALTYLYIRE